MTGSSTQGIKTVLHPVSDLAKAKAVYTALLGVAPQSDSSYYVGFEAEGQHIGLVPNGAHLTITGARALPGGTQITLTLVFAKAGKVSVPAVIANPPGS